MVFLLKKTLNDYFTRERNKLDHVVALEIGTKSAPVFNNLEEYSKEKQAKIDYRGMKYYDELTRFWELADIYGWKLNEDEKPENRPDTNQSLWYRNFAKKRLQKQEDNNTDMNPVFFPWDAQDLPYPFEDRYFTEIHNHMITGCIVEPVLEKKYKFRPSIDEYVSEINRLLKPNGIFFFTNQGHFFGIDDYTKELFKFEEEFRKRGFDLAMVSPYDPKVEVNLYHFTSNPAFVRMIVLAKKK